MAPAAMFRPHARPEHHLVCCQWAKPPSRPTAPEMDTIGSREHEAHLAAQAGAAAQVTSNRPA